MGEAQRLLEAVRASAEGSGYVVEETEDGFRVLLDIEDARWWGPLRKSGMNSIVAHEVRADEASRQLTITDTLRGLEWFGGYSLAEGTHPRLALGAGLTVQKGRIDLRSFRKSWAFDEQGRFRKVADYSFDFGEGQELVRDAARSLGWRERMPLSVKIGIAAAVVGGVGAAVTIVALLVAALLGKF